MVGRVAETGACLTVALTPLGPSATVPRNLARPRTDEPTRAASSRTVRLDIASRFEMLDVVQTVLAQSCALVGFDEDALHYMAWPCASRW